MGWLPMIVGAALCAAPIIATPNVAFAQKKKPPATSAAAGGSVSASGSVGTAGAAGTAGAGATAPAAPATPPAGGGEEDLDAPPGAAPATPPPATTPSTPPPVAGGICDIDPSACPKQADVKAAVGKSVKAEVYAVQQLYALKVTGEIPPKPGVPGRSRTRRFEINPYWGFTLNDQFVSHPGPGLALNYYLSNALAIGINANYYQPFNVDSDFNFQNRRATHVAVPLNEYQVNGALNLTYVPVYGKFASFGSFIFNYDAYAVIGVGFMRDRPIPVIDPDNRSFDWNTEVSGNVGIGLRVFVNRWFAVTAEIRDYLFPEKLESLTISPTNPQDPSTWYGDTALTNNVQAQIGISIFLPPKWDYRLPK